MKWVLALVVCGSSVFAQERGLLPPPPPMRNPMLTPEQALPAPPSLGVGAPLATVEPDTPGWIMRRGENGKWKVLWQGRWVGKNQMMSGERITNIDEYGIQVQGPNGKRNIPVISVNLGRQQKDKK